MTKRIAGKLIPLTLALFTLVLIGGGAAVTYRRMQVRHVTIAAGASNTESFVLIQALKVVVERHYPRLRIDVAETSGTTDSLQRLGRGDAQLAIAQADVDPGVSARGVAVLFDDTFQLFVHKDTPVEQFIDLKGKKIALPNSGGQYGSFLYVAKHFGLRESDFLFVGPNEDAADLAFARGEADAIFRVRALHSASIARIAQTGDVKFISIPDAAALHIEASAYMSSFIPRGSYVGNPPIPDADLPTVATGRNLLARIDLDDRVVRDITQVLMELRQELAAAIPAEDESVRPLVGAIKRPPKRTGMEPAIHPGALAYYEPAQESLVSDHIDLIAYILGIAALIWLWIALLRRTRQQHRKDYLNKYNQRIVKLMEDAQSTTSDRQIDPMRAELMEMLTEAIRDLSRDKISAQGFNSFRVMWQAAIDTLSARKVAIQVWKGSAADLSR